MAKSQQFCYGHDEARYRKTEKSIDDIPVDKVIDFRLLREVRRELSGK